MFISNNLEEFVTMTETRTPISTNYSLAPFSLSKEKGCLSGKRIWKFNSSLAKDQAAYSQFRSFCIADKSLSNRHPKREHLKDEVRKFTINYTKQQVKRNGKKEQIWKTS